MIAFSLAAVMAALLIAQSTDSSAQTLVKAKIVNFASAPIQIDSCRAAWQLSSIGLEEYLAWVTLHNTSNKTVEVIGLSLVPYAAFNDSAGQAKTSLLMVHLAPDEAMGEDYPFTDGAKQPLVGGLGVPGKWEDWSGVYYIACSVERVRFSDGTVWPN